MSKTTKENQENKKAKDNTILFEMGHAPQINQDPHWFQLLPITFFTAFIVMLVRMVPYTRPMDQFFWSTSENDLTDFFSYIKMSAILVIAGLIILLILYRIFTQSLVIKKTSIYLPMGVYALLIILSYIFSDYKEFSLLGWNDRFEGTLTLLAYLLVLFYTINSINTEKALKWIIYPLAGTSALLGLLGLSQALDRDFFRTVIGQKLLTPNVMTDSGFTMWELIDMAAEKGEQALNFTFLNREIYQTVYNINYVSFYLTLLLPLFGLLFIRAFRLKHEEPIWRKILWAALFALLLYNLIGSASSGGFLGMGFVVLIAILILNKRLISWWKPILILLVITVIISGVTYDRWSGELSSAVTNTITSSQTNENTTIKHHVDYIKMEEGSDFTEISIEGNAFTLKTYPEDWPSVSIFDSDGEVIPLAETETSPIYRLDDIRFNMCTIQPAKDEQGYQYFVLTTDSQPWVFAVTEKGTYYRNDIGHLLPLREVSSFGFEDNQGFGTGRGYIWSRTFPLLKDTLFVGHGADTYCIYFPHDDYVGKYNSVNYSSKINIIVDKPHNMYLGMAVGTGVLSVLAFLGIFLLYLFKELPYIRKSTYTTFIDYARLGIFLGLVGFMITGIVDDSSVSVMPMYYGLLGSGIALSLKH